MDTATTRGESDEHDHGHGHDEIHLPPNSWVPVALALSMTVLLVGFIVSWVVWVPGAVLTIGTLVAWFRGARNEYLELSE